ncbi:MAG: N-acetylmuramoyl-L-alanine amidase [Christensenellales bacterium]
MTKKIRKKMYLMLALFLCVVFSFGFLVSLNVQNVTATPLGITVVIDAGHGGIDGGTVGSSTGITESELNLRYAKKLTEYLQNFGITVVNTRETMDGLYDEFNEDYKQNDMQKRSDIINGCDAQLVVSLHMNKYTSPNENGAQVFYKQGDEESQKMANSIKAMLQANFDNARDLALAGDFYILNCTNVTGVLVECGFLSNPTEERNLQTEEYMNKMCYSIYSGIINYLGIANY